MLYPRDQSRRQTADVDSHQTNSTRSLLVGTESETHTHGYRAFVCVESTSPFMDVVTRFVLYGKKYA